MDPEDLRPRLLSASEPTELRARASEVRAPAIHIVHNQIAHNLIAHHHFDRILVSMADELLRLDQQLCFALYAASRAMTQLYRPALEALGLTYPQYLVMLVLWERDGLAVKDLGAKLQLDSGTLTPLLKRLQTQGLVERLRDTTDERVSRIVLTANGRALKRRAKKVPESLVCHLDDAALAHIGELRETLQHLTSLLRKEAR